MTLLLIVALPLVGAALPLLAGRWGRTPAALAAGAVTVAALALLATVLPAALAGETLRAGWDWIPARGIRLSFFADGLGAFFALLILAIGVLIVLYARFYLADREPLGRFYAYLLLFMGSMLGIVLAENLVLLVVFWELTSLSSFLLIGWWRDRPAARQGARIALVVTSAGGLALLAGVLLLGAVVGSYELTDVLAAGDTIRGSDWYPAILALVLAGAFAKSAQFPLHFWLPHAMAAPTPVSAYLHSATMVKAGVFLLARLHPALAGTDAWLYAVGGTGLATMMIASYLALLDHDLKGLLAYSTVGHLGLVTALLGFGTRAAIVAAVFHVLNHAAFKASLFMSAGIVEHETGTRDIRPLAGLFGAMPVTATLATLAAAAMAGVPPLNGFLSKEMFLEAALELGRPDGARWFVPAFVTLASVFAFAYSTRFVFSVFFQRPREKLPRVPHEPPRGMRLPVEALVALCVAIGLAPGLLAGPLVSAAAGATAGTPLDVHLHPWHGFGLPLAISVLALALGAGLYLRRRSLYRFHENRLPVPEAKAIYDRGVEALTAAAAAVTARLETGSLQRYLVLLVATALAAGAAAFAGASWSPGGVPGIAAEPVGWAAWAMLAVAALGTVFFHRRRIVAVVFLSMAGLVVTLVFVHFSAPDLALTQLSVEVVTIVLLLLALYLLPAESSPESSRGRRARDAALAAAAGAAVAAVAWLLMTRPHASISAYHIAQSKPAGGGTNVVNVILVDFRGFDTLGEIVVLAIAAVGIYALIDGFGLPTKWEVGKLEDEARHPLLLVTIARLVLPLAVLVSAFLLLRGHNQPGGGFIAGLVTAVALILQYIASGIGWTQQRIRRDFHPPIAAGVLIAGLTGVASWAFGRPFLTSAFGYVEWPVVGRFEVASAMAFDVGVYLTVVGAVLLTLVNMGKVAEASRSRLRGKFDVEEA